MKGIGIGRGIPIRIPNHQTPQTNQFTISSHRILTWYIYLRLVDFSGKCSWQPARWVLTTNEPVDRNEPFIAFVPPVLPRWEDLSARWDVLFVGKVGERLGVGVGFVGGDRVGNLSWLAFSLFGFGSFRVVFKCEVHWSEKTDPTYMQIVQNLQNTWVNLQWQTARRFSEFEDSQWHPFALSFLFFFKQPCNGRTL